MSRRGRVACAALVIAGLAIAVIVWREPFERRRGFIEGRLSRAIGLETEIRGELHLALFPTPRLEASEVTVENLPGRPSPHLLEIGRLSLVLDSWRFLLGEVEVDGLEIEDAEIRIEPDAEGRFALRHELESLADEEEEESSAESVAFRIRRLELEEARVFYDPGEGGAVTSLRLGRFALEADDFDASIALELRGELDGSPIAVTGSLGPLSELLAPTRPYPVSLRGRVFEAELELEGTVEEPRALRGVDASISGLITDLVAVPGRPERRPARVGPIRVAARVKKPDDVISVEDLVLVTRGDHPLRAEVRGSVGDLRAFRGVALELRVEADDLRWLEPFADRPLPEIDSLSARASIADRDGSLGIEGRLRASAFGEQLTLELAGGQDDLSRIEDLDLRFELFARDLAVIGEDLVLERELPAIGPVHASGRLRDRAGALAVEELTARLGREGDVWAEIDGSIEDLITLRGVRLSGRFGLTDLNDAVPNLGYRLPDIGPIRGSASLSDEDGSLGLEDLRLGGGREGSFEVALTGGFDDLREIDEIAFEVTLEARDLAVVGRLIGAELPPIGPVEFSGRIAGSDERIVAGGARLRLDETRLEGDLSGSFVPGTRPSLRAAIRSPHLHLDDVGIGPDDEATTVPVEASEDSRRTWSADEPLPFEQLRALDLELDFQADRITGSGGLDLTGVATSVRLDDGELSIHNAVARFNEGDVQLALRIDARTPVPVLTMEGEASGVDIGGLVAQFQKSGEAAGILDASLALRSHGSTRRELLSHLEGRVRFLTREGTLASRYARRMIRDLLRVSIPTFRLSKKAPKVRCAIAEFEIEDGVATVETLFLNMPGGTVTGVGKVDLGRNRFDLRLTPRPVDPGLVSVAVTVDVTGPLNTPTFTPVPRTFATSAVQGLISNAMKPARVLLSPFQRGAAERGNPCAAEKFEGSLEGE